MTFDLKLTWGLLAFNVRGFIHVKKEECSLVIYFNKKAQPN